MKINEETENFFGKCTDFDFTQQIKSNMFYLARAEIYYILNNHALSRKEQNKMIREVMRHPRVVRMLKGYNIAGMPISFQVLYLSIRYKSVGLRRFISLLSKLLSTCK